MLKFYCAIVASWIVITCCGQSTKLDSIHRVLPGTKDTTRVNLLVKIGLESYTSSPDKAEEIANEIIEESKKLNYQPGLAQGRRLLGITSYVRSNHQLAHGQFKSALTIAAGLGDKSLIASVLNNMGMNHLKQGNYLEALENLLRSLQLYEELKDTKRIGALYNNIGIVYDDQNDNTKALSYYQKARASSIQTGDEKTLSNSLNNIGNCYKNLEKYDSAIWFHEQSLALRKKLGDKWGESSSYYNLATVFKRLKQYPKALQYLEMNCAIKEDMKDTRGIANCMSARADIYLHTNEFEKAKKCIDEANFYLSKTRNREPFKNLYERTAEYYEAIGDYKSALHWKNRYYELKDTLFTESKSRQLAELQTLYDLSKKENEIALLEAENKQTQLEKTMSFTLIAVLLLFGMMLFAWQRQKQRQKKKIFETEQTLVRAELLNAQLAEQELRRELNFKNKELASYTVNFIQKSRLMEEMKAGLEQLGKSKGEDLHRKIQSMNRIIDSNFQIDKEWDDFRLQFEQIHLGFFERLKRQCSDLTTGDLKLCAMIKLNMNAKESARVLGISPESVKTARYRLRRKLRLDKNQSLTNFILGIDDDLAKNDVPVDHQDSEDLVMA